MKLVSLTCPSCGGTMEVDPSQKKAVCPFCGGSVLIDSPDYEKLAYERRMGAARAEEELEKARRDRERRRKLIAIGAAALVLLLVASLVVWNTPAAHVTEANPFAALTVRFVGDSGSGRVELENHGQGDLRSVSFTVTPEYDLYNGDSVTIQAENLSGYRFTPREMTLEVTGLTETVTSLGQLSAEDLSRLHANTERLVREEWDVIVESGKATGYQTEPFRCYLFLEEDRRDIPANYLYDCFCTVVTRADGSELTVYQPCRYDSLKKAGDGTLKVEYGDLVSFNLGYYYGFLPESSFSGWTDLQEMEASLTSARASCTLATEP